MEHNLFSWGIKNSDLNLLRSGNVKVNKEDQKFLEVALKSDVEKMKDCIKSLTSPESTDREKLDALDELIGLTEYIDNSSDFVKINGFNTILEILFSDSYESEVCIGAAWVLGNCLQNNPFAISEFLKIEGVIKKLLDLIISTKNDEFRSKLAFSMVALLNHTTQGPTEFIKAGGFECIKQLLNLPNNIRSKRKIVFAIGMCCLVGEWNNSLKPSGILDCLLSLFKNTDDLDLQEIIVDSLRCSISNENSNENLFFVKNNCISILDEWIKGKPDFDESDKWWKKI